MEPSSRLGPAHTQSHSEGDEVMLTSHPRQCEVQADTLRKWKPQGESRWTRGFLIRAGDEAGDWRAQRQTNSQAEEWGMWGM